MIGYYKVEKFSTTKSIVKDVNGNVVTKVPGTLYSQMKAKVLDNGNALYFSGDKWKQVPMREYEAEANKVATPVPSSELPEEHVAVMNMIHSSYDLKPKGLKMNELKWKYLIRSGVRGKNIMMTGPAGCGKTMAAKALVNALDRPDYYFNLGATQDPRATLIGNVTFDKETGTSFSEALFVKAIQQENAVILLDELSRAHPDAWNILMTVLDSGQRYLRLDEAEDQATIKVADGVTFIATANIGNEYTSTRTMDKALMDRFTIIEMDLLSSAEESDLLQYMFPLVNKKALDNVAQITALTRSECNKEESRLSSPVSTRTSVEVAGLLFDGFKLEEAAEITMYPQYSNDGGIDSERTFIKQIVQKFCDDGTEDDLFNVEENDDSMEYAKAN